MPGGAAEIAAAEGAIPMDDVRGCSLGEAEQRLARFSLEVRVTGRSLAGGTARVIRQKLLSAGRVELVVAFWPAQGGSKELAVN